MVTFYKMHRGHQASGTGGRNDKSRSFSADLRNQRWDVERYSLDISCIITFVCSIFWIHSRLAAAVTSRYARETSCTHQVPTSQLENLSTKTGRNSRTISRGEGEWYEEDEVGTGVGPTNEHVHHYVCIVDKRELLNLLFSSSWSTVAYVAWLGIKYIAPRHN